MWVQVVLWGLGISELIYPNNRHGKEDFKLNIFVVTFIRVDQPLLVV